MSTTESTIPSLAELIGAGDFQWGYVTNDLDRACEEAGRALGISDWVKFTPELQAQQDGIEALTRMSAAFGVVGDRLIELCQPIDGLTGVFANELPDDSSQFTVRFHHMGVRVPSVEQVRQRLAADGRRFTVTWGVPGQVSVGFVDLRAFLGHYVEVLEFTDEGWQFIEHILSGGGGRRAGEEEAP